MNLSHQPLCQLLLSCCVPTTCCAKIHLVWRESSTRLWAWGSRGGEVKAGSPQLCLKLPRSNLLTELLGRRYSMKMHAEPRQGMLGGVTGGVGGSNQGHRAKRQGDQGCRRRRGHEPVVRGRVGIGLFRPIRRQLPRGKTGLSITRKTGKTDRRHGLKTDNTKERGAARRQ